jgi:hypothetical protein
VFFKTIYGPWAGDTRGVGLGPAVLEVWAAQVAQAETATITYLMEELVEMA